MLKVLIVDDDEVSRKSLASVIPWESCGMEIVGDVPNVPEAVRLLQQLSAELLILDLSVPLAEETEQLRMLREKNPGLPFAVISDSEEYESIRTFLRLGAVDYISTRELRMSGEKELTAVFTRICRQAGRQADLEPADVPPETPELSETGRFEPIRLRWEQLKWIFSDREFRNLCSESFAQDIPAAFLKKIFAETALKVQSSLHIAVDPWPIRPTARWAENYRAKVYHLAEEATTYNETSVCVLRAVLHIKRNLSGSLHAEDVAESVGMGRSYFSQCFERFTGSTFNDFIRTERVAQAKELLCETRLPVRSVAQKVGYEDDKYFSRLFREETSMLPSKYREVFNKVDV